MFIAFPKIVHTGNNLWYLFFFVCAFNMLLRETQLSGMKKLILNMHIKTRICFLQLRFPSKEFYYAQINEALGLSVPTPTGLIKVKFQLTKSSKKGSNPLPQLYTS